MVKKTLRKEIILKKLKEIEEYMELIEDSIPENSEKFQSDQTIKDATYKREEFISQNIIDICAIISSDLNLGVPTSEDDYINNLEKAEILTKEWAAKIKEIKGFRNILVHRYGEVDDELAFQNINNWFDDYNKFIKLVEDILKDKEENEK